MAALLFLRNADGAWAGTDDIYCHWNETGASRNLPGSARGPVPQSGLLSDAHLDL